MLHNISTFLVQKVVKMYTRFVVFGVGNYLLPQKSNSLYMVIRKEST